MDMRLGTLPLFALMIFGAVQPVALAHIVTLEPDAYAAGTDISNAWAHEGITVTRVYGTPGSDGPTYGPVYSSATSSRPAFTGSRDFGGTALINDMPGCVTDPNWPCWLNWPNYYSAIQVTFDRPVDFVEAFGVWSIDYIGMILLGADGQEIDYITRANVLFTEAGWLFGSTQAVRSSRDIYGVDRKSVV